MTLIQFIKSQISQASPLGDLAEEVMNDKNFPHKRNEQEIISYLNFISRSRGNIEAFEALVEGYEACRDIPVDITDLNVKYNPLKVEYWKYLKRSFRADRAIIVENSGTIYIVYAVDSVSKSALKFEIYGRQQLNEISIIQLTNIFHGKRTIEVSIPEAIDRLLNDVVKQPIQPNFSEMVSYLKSQDDR